MAPTPKSKPSTKPAPTLNDQLEEKVVSGLTNLDFVIHFHLTGKTPPDNL